MSWDSDHKPNFTNIFKDGVLVDVNVSFWSGSKVLRAEDLGLKEEDVAEAYKLGKKMLVPADVIKAFRRIESRARHTVDDSSFRFPIGNSRFVPKRKFPSVLKKLEECKKDYLEKVEGLIENYAKYREQMLPVYTQAAETAFINQSPETHTFGPEYDREKEKADFTAEFLRRIDSYYPPAESLRSKFSLSWSVYEIAIPRMRKGSSTKIAVDETKKQIAENEYRAEIHDKISKFVEEVVTTLRKETAEMCGRITANIADGKIVKGNTLKSIRNFIDRFEEMNFVGDVEVSNQLQALREKFLDVHTSDEVREDVELQMELKRKLTELSDAVVDMTDINSVTGEYQRKVLWQEEPAGVA